jgi:hypothetical protein
MANDAVNDIVRAEHGLQRHPLEALFCHVLSFGAEAILVAAI